jgi:hypothetical protein
MARQFASTGAPLRTVLHLGERSRTVRSMFRLQQEDLPGGWKLLRGPIDRRQAKALNTLVAASGSIDWYEIEGCMMRLLLGVLDLGEEPIDRMHPFIQSVLVMPGSLTVAGSALPLPSITASDLRAIPLEAIDRAMAARWSAEGSTIAGLRQEIGEGADELLRRPDEANRATFNARVALAYLRALGATRNPTRAIADEAGVPHATAQRWVVAARKAGHLPPARPGRAG